MNVIYQVLWDSRKPMAKPDADRVPRHGPKGAAFVLNGRDGPGTFTGLAQAGWHGKSQLKYDNWG